LVLGTSPLSSNSLGSSWTISMKILNIYDTTNIVSCPI
jgi:hypothetical protein